MDGWVSGSLLSLSHARAHSLSLSLSPVVLGRAAEGERWCWWRRRRRRSGDSILEMAGWASERVDTTGYRSSCGSLLRLDGTSEQKWLVVAAIVHFRRALWALSQRCHPTLSLSRTAQKLGMRSHALSSSAHALDRLCWLAGRLSHTTHSYTRTIHAHNPCSMLAAAHTPSTRAISGI